MLLRRCLWVAAVAVCVAGVARGDTLVTKDGRTFEGRIISRGKSVVFEAHKYGSKITVTIPSTNVASLTEGAVKAPTYKPPVRPTKRKWGNLPPEPKAPPITVHRGATYYVIPLVGEVGKTFVADVLERSLADAARRRPTAVILHVDSPGGRIDEVERLVAAIRKYKKGLRIVVLVKRAISAAAITSMACDEIYVQPSSIIGAATAFRVTPKGTAAAIDEKMQSVWRAIARNTASIGGHSPLLANAMVDASMELYVVERGGKKVIVDRRPLGGATVTRRGRLLAMTADESVACGLALGKAEDFADLGKRLKRPGWTECEGVGKALAEYRAKALKVLTEDMNAIKKKYDEHMTSAVESAPWRGKYEYYSNTGKFTRSSWRRWNERSRKCVGYLMRAQGDLSEAAAIAEKFPRIFGSPKWIREQEERIKAARKKIAEESRKSSPL